jgi:hypothetical protein
MDASGHTFVFALEIEVVTVSTIWRQPARCAEFLRVCDPLVHLTQPYLRIILEAVQIAYAELNAADWATVVEVVRELGQFEEVGGLDGLNTVYSATEITPVIDPIFNHHIELLQEYARARQMDPPRPVHRFSGGRGTARINKASHRPANPEYLGDAIVRGLAYVVRVDVSSDGTFLNFRLEPKH